MAGKAKRPVWTEVACKEHGRQSGDPHIPMSVRVTSKGTRTEKQGGVGLPCLS